MKHNSLMNFLKLAYSPISNYSFEYLKNEKIVQEILDDSMLYIIAQRRILTFEKIIHNTEDNSLMFEIHQQGTRNVIKCILPLHQKIIEPDVRKSVYSEFLSHNPQWIHKEKPIPPYNEVDAIKFYSETNEFLLWITPEKFLFHYWNGVILADVEENYKDLMKYKVHYVGKATGQKIWNRLTGHDKLQKILGIQYPFNFGALPTHEIVLLLFRIGGKIGQRILDGTESESEWETLLSGNATPSDMTVSLDAEKALISILKPNYCEKGFPNYPKSSDGLYDYSLDGIFYKIRENITLVYDEGEFEGNVNDELSSTIVVRDNKSVSKE